MFWTEIEFLFYAMIKKNKNKGKNPKPIPLTKYTNILVGKEKKKSFADVVEFYKRTGLLPVMNDSSVEKAVKWYLYDLRNNKDNSISKEKEKQTKSLAKRYSKDRKTKATESELLILSEINKIGLSDIKFQEPLYVKEYGEITKFYIADFLDTRNRIDIEIDGGYHFVSEQLKKDKKRDRDFKKMGYSTLRITNEEVNSGKALGIIKDFYRKKGLYA